MAFSDSQVRQLRAKLEAKHVKTRNANGTHLHYVEGWHVIAEANRIFGYDAWDRRTLASRCVWSGQSGAQHAAAYTAKVRVSVRAGDITIVSRGGLQIRSVSYSTRSHTQRLSQSIEPTPHDSACHRNSYLLSRDGTGPARQVLTVAFVYCSRKFTRP